MDYRHGDMALISTEKVPEEAKESMSKTLLVGSGNHPHTFDKGKFYGVDDEFIVGYLVAKNTTLYHPEHGEDVGKGLREAKIDDGIYEVRKQVEYTPEGLRQVED